MPNILEIYTCNIFEFKRIENKETDFAYLELDMFRDKLYNINSMVNEILTNKGNIETKVLIDKYKIKYDSVAFTYHDLYDCLKVSFNNPKFEVVEDENNYPCIKLTWDLENA